MPTQFVGDSFRGTGAALIGSTPPYRHASVGDWEQASPGDTPSTDWTRSPSGAHGVTLASTTGSEDPYLMVSGSLTRGTNLLIAELSAHLAYSFYVDTSAGQAYFFRDASSAYFSVGAGFQSFDPALAPTTAPCVIRMEVSDTGSQLFVNNALVATLGVGLSTSATVVAATVSHRLVDEGFLVPNGFSGVLMDYIHVVVGGTTGPLGPPSTSALISAPSPLGSPALMSARAGVRMTMASPLGAVALCALNDFSALIGADAVTRYLLDLVTPAGDVRVPISSWQATLRAQEVSYVQCVVPACQQWVGAISDSTDFRIIRRTMTRAGDAAQLVIASSELQTVSLAQGAHNYSATLSGYGPRIEATESVELDLLEIRTVFTYTTGYRVRCAVDWVLRPGHTARFSGTSFVVRYITYYIQGDDAFMDVGQ